MMSRVGRSWSLAVELVRHSLSWAVELELHSSAKVLRSSGWAAELVVRSCFLAAGLVQRSWYVAAAAAGELHSSFLAEHRSWCVRLAAMVRRIGSMEPERSFSLVVASKSYEALAARPRQRPSRESKQLQTVQK